MTNKEKVKHIREITFSPINKINDALKRTNGDVDAAVKILVEEKQADANDMANRVADACIVYSYVHNNRIGAMIGMACQTDFVAKNESFLGLAKDLCMHIVSAPKSPEYVDEKDVPAVRLEMLHNDTVRTVGANKPPSVLSKIIEGKVKKFYAEVCLVHQPFIKDDTKTVGQVINEVSSTLGEKIEIKQFVKMTAQ